MKDSILMQKTDEFAYQVYKISKDFPREEMYGITSQLRRAALSIPLNITEGYARQSKNEYHRFLTIAYGSFKKTKYLLHFAHREQYLHIIEYREILGLADEVGRTLWAALQTTKKDYCFLLTVSCFLNHAF